jgi:hypothetical protein
MKDETMVFTTVGQCDWVVGGLLLLLLLCMEVWRMERRLAGLLLLLVLLVGLSGLGVNCE